LPALQLIQIAFRGAGNRPAACPAQLHGSDGVSSVQVDPRSSVQLRSGVDGGRLRFARTPE